MLSAKFIKLVIKQNSPKKLSSYQKLNMFSLAVNVYYTNYTIHLFSYTAFCLFSPKMRENFLMDKEIPP